MQSRRGPSLLTFVIALVLIIYYVIQGWNKTSTPTSVVPASNSGPTSTASTSNSGTTSIGQRTKTSNCVSVNALPDSACTPGAILPDATSDQICQSGYSSTVRNVPDALKNEVYSEYGITSHAPGQYEVDHFISLELGGSNDIANLWPEPAEPRPGFHEKDKVENYLHDQVCSGKMSLQDAQLQIATNWLKIYEGIP
jgi:hypothetical protein